MSDQSLKERRRNKIVNMSERGQIVIVASLIIGVLFISLALIVNGAIYSENLSSQGTTNTENAVSSTNVAFEKANFVLSETNKNHNYSYKTLARNYSKSVTYWDRDFGKEHSFRGNIVRLKINDTLNGTYVRDTNASSNFTDATNSEENWTLVTDVTSITDYRMTINRDSLYTDDGSGTTELFSKSFLINVTDETGAKWKLYIYENTENEVTIHPVVDGTEKPPCSADGVEIEIDFVTETVGGNPCESLTFAQGLSGSIDLEYRDADKIGGTYEFRVDQIINPSTDDHYTEYGEGEPSATPNIHSATVTSAYTNSKLSIERQQQIIAGDGIYTE